MGARGRGALALALAAALLGPAVARGDDPALRALGGSDAYASRAALGAGAATARSRLAREARRLADRGQQVKLAVVEGPAGARTMRVYARNLREALGYEGTIVVSAPGRPAVAAGPRTPAEITLAVRRSGANRDPDPVDRVIRAAEAAAPPAPAGSGWRGVLGFALLAALGALWAAAWGVRRERRRQRTAVADARALARLRLDALRARALDLRTRAGRPEAARRALDEVTAAADVVLADLESAGSAQDVDRAVASLDGAERRLREAAALAGEHLDPDAPFEGLCAVDPGHGAAAGARRGSAPASPRPRCARPARRRRAAAPRRRGACAGARAAGPLRRAPGRYRQARASRASRATRRSGRRWSRRPFAGCRSRSTARGRGGARRPRGCGPRTPRRGPRRRGGAGSG